jgi:acetyl-CoA synthetase
MVYDFDNFDPKKLTVIVKEYGVTSFCAPPTVYRYLVKKGMSDMPTLKHATTAGEALSPEVFRKFEEMSGLELMEAFGQTESTLILGNFKGSKSCPGSMGKASPLYHVELMKNDGTFAKDNEMGELVIVPPENGRQLGIFSAYYENEELYQYVWRDGVYHTGDIAWRNEEGYYFFHGRIDDVIKTGGYRVGPYEVENVLMEHPAVLECSVVGIPDTLRGQAIKAFVVLAAGYEPTNELMKELRDGCNSRLAEYKWIRKLEFVTEMPKTISGKIRRVELRERKPEEKK